MARRKGRGEAPQIPADKACPERTPGTLMDPTVQARAATITGRRPTRGYWDPEDRELHPRRRRRQPSREFPSFFCLFFFFFSLFPSSLACSSPRRNHTRTAGPTVPWARGDTSTQGHAETRQKSPGAERPKERGWRTQAVTKGRIRGEARVSKAPSKGQAGPQLFRTRES